MNKFLRVLFVLVIIAMTGAIIFQLFFPSYMGSHSGYGISVGWQREIGIWNVAVLVILLAVNLKYDWFYLRAVLIALILGGLGIGTNHFLSYLQYHHSVNAVGAFENYLLVLGWIVGWWLENFFKKKQFNFSEVIAWLATPCVIINRHYHNRGKHMSKQLKGSLMVITAGIAWGISGVSGQYLMSHGVNVNLLTSLRLILAGTLLTASVFFRQRDKLVQAIQDRKTLVSIALFALFGLVLNQYAYLSAIQYTNAGTATVLQYVTPVLILAFVCAKNRRFSNRLRVSGDYHGYCGNFYHRHAWSGDRASHHTYWFVLGPLFQPVTYALYILLPAKAIEKWGSLIVIGLGLLIGGMVFPIAIQAWKYKLPLTGGNLLALFGLVFIGTVFAYTVFLKGTTMVGAVKGSLLASVEPIASVILTVLIMGDRFFAIDVVGMFLIVLAVIIISLKNLVALKKQEKIQR